MEKKELYSMMKHRGVFLGLALAALVGVMGSEARAASLTLSVYAGSGTGGMLIDSFTGGSQSISLTAAQLAILNSDLAAAGFSAYSFANLSGTSNNPGLVGGGFIQSVGQLQASTTGTGAGMDITVSLTEDSFSLPASGQANLLGDAANANYKGNGPGAASSNTSNTGIFTDSASPPTSVSTSPAPLPSSGGLFDNPSSTSSAPLGTYVGTYSLTSNTVLRLTALAGNTGTNGYSNTVSVTGAVPEPASVVMMLTGMPLPLVVLGILRRRRAAA
jgi:hypothetical protein